jgi:hypothetical protein
MKSLVMCTCLVVWVCSAVCGEEDKKPVPTYTNEDLDRVSPLRGQTGALSQPGSTPQQAGRETAGSARPRGPARNDESYWRQEAARVRRRVQGLRRRAVDLRAQLEEARRKAWEDQTDVKASRRGGAAGRRGASTALLEQRIQALEQEIREHESELEERARRAGALPGWLR